MLSPAELCLELKDEGRMLKRGYVIEVLFCQFHGGTEENCIKLVQPIRNEHLPSHDRGQTLCTNCGSK
jgi:hypothetical protein